MAVKHTDGWQAKKISDSIRDQGRDESKRNNAKEKMETGRTMEGLRHVAKLASNTKIPDITTAKPASNIKSDIRNQPDYVPKNSKEAIGHNAQASQEYLNAQKSAQGLDKLTSTAPLIKENNPTARELQNQKAIPNQPNQNANNAKALPPQISAQLLNKGGKERGNAEDKTPARKTAKDIKEKTEDKKSGDDILKSAEKPNDTANINKAKSAAINAGQPVPVAKESAKTESSNVREKVKSRDKSEKSDGVGKSGSGYIKAPKNYSGELGALLGGSKQDGTEGDAESQPSSQIKSEKPSPMPDGAPGFKVFNEYDEEKPGMERLKSKAQLFENGVLKPYKEKLTAIAKLNEELDHRIRSLSDRIVGELKDEIELADFHKSIYGGLHG